MANEEITESPYKVRFYDYDLSNLVSEVEEQLENPGPSIVPFMADPSLIVCRQYVLDAEHAMDVADRSGWLVPTALLGGFLLCYFTLVV